MTVINPEQQQAVTEAGGAPVELVDPRTGESFVLVRAEIFLRMCELLNGENPDEHEAWAALARKTRGHWAAENPY